ncbi:MAG: hypothetical protein ACJ76Y_29160 [Thermoanaerobaculia bacterium]
MREIAKSLTSFSWAVSLLGAQQLVNLVQRPTPGSGAPSSTGLDDVTRETGRQLDGYLRDVFEAGDQVQRSAIDLAYGVFTLEALSPNRLAALSADVVRQSTSALSRLLPGGGRLAQPSPSANSSANPGARGCQPCGWGPMPPAR